jgi:predicted N-acetyltransferase YhbS
MISIRREHPQDVQGIREVNISAFGQPQEPDIVDELRRNCSSSVDVRRSSYSLSFQSISRN